MSLNLQRNVGTTDTEIVIIGSLSNVFAPGFIQIDSEVIAYSGATANSFYGCTRASQSTSAATHAVNASVTVLESAPANPALPANTLLIPLRPSGELGEADNAGKLTDPSSITVANVDQNSVLWLFGHAGNVVVTLPTPTANLSRKLYVMFTTDAAKTCSVNSVTITAGTGQLFVYNVTAASWFAC